MAADGFQFAFTPEVEAQTAPVWEKVRHHVTPMEWRARAPLIAAINRLKAEKDAVILAHNYMTPEIFHGVGDYVGDSLGLAKEAARSKARVIVQAGVHFMAETSKILSPDKTVLIPDLRAGCSLAASITGADVRLIKQRYPGVPVVTYVNTTAEVKAETDICCTSANAVQVVEEAARLWGTDRVILPDRYQDHRLEGPLRGARALHRRRHPGNQRGLSRRRSFGPPRMPGRGAGSRRLRGLDGGDERLCPDAQAQAGGVDHRVLDG